MTGPDPQPTGAVATAPGPACLCSDPEDDHAVNTDGGTRYRARCTRPGCGCTLYRPASAAARRLDVVLAEVEEERDEYARALREVAGAARAAYPSAEDALRAIIQRADHVLGEAGNG